MNILRKVDRDQVVHVSRRHGVSEQTICTWRQRFRGMSDDVKKLRQLEQDKARLRKLLIERDRGFEVMTGFAAKNGTPPARGVRAEARTVTRQCVCADIRLPLDVAL